MAISVAERHERPIDISLREAAGALGDSITVLPIVVALGVATPLSLPHVLIWFGVFQAVWGYVYGLPISLEPMKALAGLAIAGALSYGELVTAGLLAGIVLLAAGRLGLVGRLGRSLGAPVVRGVQLAVALLLGRSAVSLLGAAPETALLAAGVAGGAFLGGTILAGRDRGLQAMAPAAVGVGLALALAGGVPAPSLPGLTLFPAGGPTLSTRALSGTAAQLAMTVGNAAVATAVLCADLFEAEVSPDELAGSMGLTCLVSVPLGGLPMCHGSGGLAGKHAFGARTGGANLVLGGAYLLAVPFAGLIVAFPTAVLGVLLAVVALQLASTALGEVEGRAGTGLAVAVGAVGLAWNVGAAFVLGALAWNARSFLGVE